MGREQKAQMPPRHARVTVAAAEPKSGAEATSEQPVLDFGGAAPSSSDPPIAENAEGVEIMEEDEPEEEEKEEEEVGDEEEEEPEEIEEEELEEVEGEEEVVEQEEADGEIEDEEEGERGGEERGEGEKEEADVQEPVKERRKQKDYEVFVGGLPRDATEEDLKKAFEKVGEVVEVRLVKQLNSQKNKGFAFVRYATIEQAKRATTELRQTRVKGKSCGVLRSNDNETLHLGNICTSWTKNDLVEKLKDFGLENLEEVHLIEDPKNKGRNRGYAFLDFSTHMDAVAACSMLQKRTVYLGTDLRVEVSFSKTVEPDEEVMAQVKSVFLDGLPATWDEAQVHEHFKKFGEIENVQLACHMPTAKRKDFCFISFATREAVLDCIEKVNKDGIGEGAEKVLVKATLKKPLQKRVPTSLGVSKGYIGKSIGGKGLQSHRIYRSYPSRFERARELGSSRYGNRLRGHGWFSSRESESRAATSTMGKDGALPRRESVRVHDTPIAHNKSGDSYLESCSSDRHASRSYRDISANYSRYQVLDSNVDNYDPRMERYDSGARHAYDRHAFYRIRHPYSDVDGDLLPPYSPVRHGRSRSGLEIGSYPQQGASAYNEYSRNSRDECYDYDRGDYASRGYGSRYLPSRGTSRSYY